jgi:hypothetical protein
MSAIVTHRFRRNNVQNIFDEMLYPRVMIASCSCSTINATTASVTTIGTIPSNLQTGMMVVINTGSGSLTTSTTTIVTGISTGSNSFTISPAPVTALSGTLLSFYSQYYIGIGKSDSYSGGLEGSDFYPGVPVPTEKTSIDAKANLIAMQKVVVGSIAGVPAIFGNAGYLLPRYQWGNGNYYKAWDPSDPTCFYPTTATIGSTQQTVFPCFVVSGSSPRIYVCVASGYDSATQLASSVEPSSITTGSMGTVGSKETNGYQWVYVSDLGLDTASTSAATYAIGTTTSLSSTGICTPGSLDSNQFVRIYRNATTVGTASTIIAATSSAGAVYSMRIVTGGVNYTTNSTFVIDGDGTSTASGIVTAIDAAGGITSTSITSYGSGYTIGAVRFTANTGSGAILTPRIAPKNGFGYNVVSDLPSWFAGFFGSLNYSAVYPGNSDVPSTDSIRQVTLIRNPVVFTSSTGSTYTYRCLKYLTINTGSGSNVASGDVIEISNSRNSRGYVDYVVATGSTTTVYYHQNTSTFQVSGSPVNITPIPFTSGSTYKVYKYPSYTPATSTYTITSVSTCPIGTAGSDEYSDGTGEVIYIHNHTPIYQASGQNINFTVVTQF